MQIRHFVFNPLMENTYVVYDQDTGTAVIIDPGCTTDTEKQRLSDFLDRNALSLQAVLCTHLHFDHMAGCRYLHDRYHTEPMGMRADLPLAREARQMARMFAGVDAEEGYEVSSFLTDGMELSFGPMSFRVIATPGHTPGGCCLHMPQESLIFTGDTLFQGSVGRADFSYSSYADLIDSIQTRLMTLDDSIRLLPGHGPATTIGFERQYNPFL